MLEYDLSVFLTASGLISLLTLALLEIILGIDNIVFISILCGKLPPEQRARGRKIGLMLALVTRVLLLLCAAWLAQLTKPLFEFQLFGMEKPHGVSWRDLVLLVGGLFLLYQATKEIHHKLEGEDGGEFKAKAPTFRAVVIHIAIMDIIFSLDSVITAVGMVKNVSLMIAGVFIAMGVMLAFSGKISDFIEKHPSLKMLALSFLMMIGCLLVAESCHVEIPKGYIYFSMAFSLAVEVLNIRLRTKSAVKLRQEIR